MPQRVEIGSAHIRELNLNWGEQAATAAASRRGRFARGERRAHAAGRQLAGGRARRRPYQQGFPSLDVKELQLRYRAPTLFVQSAELRQGERGTLRVSGEVQLEQSVDLQVKLESIDIAPLLPVDWRVRLHGNLAGDVNIRTRLPAHAPPTLSGSLRLEEGSSRRAGARSDRFVHAHAAVSADLR
jgi:hypothetical protein